MKDKEALEYDGTEENYLTVLGCLNGALMELENGDISTAKREIHEALKLLGFAWAEDYPDEKP